MVRTMGDLVGEDLTPKGVSYRDNRGGHGDDQRGLGLEEGVGVAFVADGGGGAVAGVDDGVVGEME